MYIQILKTEASPRDVLLAHFKSLGGELPICGGWGYSMQDACILSNENPDADGIPFDWLGWQDVFIEKRLHEELIIQRPVGDSFSGIQWRHQSQRLVHQGGRAFDHITVEVQAMPERVWEELKAEFEGAGGIENPNFDFDKHLAKRQQSTITLIREYWFDITGKFR